MAQNLDSLYNNLKTNPTVELPDLNTFKQKYGSEEGFSNLYKALGQNNTIELPEFQDFKQKYFGTPSPAPIAPKSDVIKDKGIQNVMFEPELLYQDYFGQKGIEKSTPENTPSPIPTDLKNLNESLFKSTLANHGINEDILNSDAGVLYENQVSKDYLQALDNLKSVGKTDSNGQFVKTDSDINADLGRQLSGLQRQKKELNEKIQFLKQSSQAGPLTASDEANRAFKLAQQYSSSTDKTRVTPEDTKSAIKNLQSQYDELNNFQQSIKGSYVTQYQKRNPIARLAVEDPAKFNQLDEASLLKTLSQIGGQEEALGNQVLFDANKINTTTLLDGTDIENVLRLPIIDKENPDVPQNVQAQGNLRLNKAEVQRFAKQGVSSTVNSIGKTIENRIKYINSLQEEINAKANEVKLGQGSQEDLQQLVNEQNEQKSQIEQSKKSLSKILSLNSKYFSNYDNFVYSKAKLEELAKAGFNWETDVKKPFEDGSLNQIKNMADFTTKYAPLMVKEKLGYVSPEQKTAQLLGFKSDRDYDYTRMQPDYLKNLQFINLGDKKPTAQNIWNSLSFRSLGYQGVKTTISSLTLAAPAMVTGGATEALGLAEGTAAKFLADKAIEDGVIITSSVLQMSPDMIDQYTDKFKQGQLSEDKILSSGVLDAAIEGHTEGLLLPQLKIFKGLDLAKQAALSRVLSGLAGRETLSIAKEAAKEIAQRSFDTAWKEGAEEVYGNFLHDLRNSYLNKENPDYAYDPQFTLKGNIETMVNTAMSMLPTIFLDMPNVVRSYNQIKNKDVMKGIMYDLASNPQEYTQYAVDYINNTKNLSKVLPEFVDKKQAISIITEQYNNLSASYKEASPVLSELENDNDKVDFFTAYNTVRNLTLKPNLNPEEVKILDENNKIVEKYTKEANEAVEERTISPLRYESKRLSNYIDNITQTIETDDVTKLSAIKSILEKNKERWSGVSGFEELKQKIDNHLEKVNSLISKDFVQEEETPVEQPQPDLNNYDFLQSLIDSGDNFITQKELDNLDDIGLAEKVQEYKNKNKESEDAFEQKVSAIMDSDLPNTHEEEESKLSRLTDLEFEYSGKGDYEKADRIGKLKQSLESVQIGDKLFNIGDKVSYQGSEYYVNTQNGTPVLSTKKNLNEENNTTVVPKSPQDIELLGENIPIPETTNLEAKKADIERRRQEDLSHSKNLPEEQLQKGRNNTKNIISSIKEKYPPTTIEGIILRILENLVDFSKYATIVDDNYLKSRQASGQATWYGMIITQEVLNGLLASRENAIHTFIHEIIHGFTTSKISDYNIANKNLISGYKSKLTEKEKQAIEELQRIFEKVKSLLPKSKEYGFTNLDEFVAEAFSNKEFQSILKAIPSEGKKSNIFKDLIKSITDLFYSWLENSNKRNNIESIGREKFGTILEDIFGWTEDLINENKPLAYLATSEEINAKYDAELATLEGEINTKAGAESKPVPTQEEETKIAVINNKVASEPVNPFRTISVGNSDPIEKVFTAVAQKLSKLPRGNSFLQHGYTISIYSAQEMLKSYPNSLAAKDLNFLNENPDYPGKYTVITDSLGEPIYFDEEGNKTTSDKGFLAVNTLPVIKDGKLNQKFRRTDEELKAAGYSREVFNQQVEKLKEARDKESKTTYYILGVSSGTFVFDESQPQKASTVVGNKQATLEVSGAKVSIKVDNKNIFLQSPTLTPNQVISLTNILFSKSKDNPTFEGLPESLHPLSERFKYLQNFIVTGLNYYNKIGNQKLYLDLRLGGKGEKAGLYAKVDNSEWRYLETPEEIANVLSQLRFRTLNNTNAPITFYNFNTESKKFEAQSYPTYTDFVLDNYYTYSQKTPQKEITNHYIEIGDEVKSPAGQIVFSSEQPPTVEIETPVTPERKPELITPSVSEKTQKTRVKYDVEDIDISGIFDLKRAKNLITKTTPEQEQKAKEWFESHPISKHITLKQFSDIVNSEAWATWSNSTITLWKGAKSTDLYHEAWHEFSQVYLTKEQKKALYDEIRKLDIDIKLPNGEIIKSSKASDFQIEEHIAEDFRNYVLSNQSLILNQRPKRNSIFRKIYNFLKELFTGNVDLQTYYERLYSGNISQYTRNAQNALFGSLNSGIEGSERTLSNAETKQLYNALDSIIGSIFQKAQKPITLLFEKNNVLSAIYGVSNQYLKKSYNSILDNLNKSSDPITIESYSKTLDNIQFILDNWQQVIKDHSRYSSYFNISKDRIQFDENGNLIDTDFDEESDDDNQRDSAVIKNENGTYSKEAASNETLYLIASLPKYDRKGNPIENDFLPFVNDITPFSQTWDLISKNLSGIDDYNQITNKLKFLSKEHKQFEDLLKRLPDPEKEILTDEEIRLRNAFINDLSKPTVYTYEAVITQEGSGIRVNYTKSEASNIKKLLDKSVDNFVAAQNNPYAKQDEDGNNYLDVPLVVNDFEKYFPLIQKTIDQIDKDILFDARIQFLNALGLQFSDETLESPSFKKIVTGLNSPVAKTYRAMKELNQSLEGTQRLITSPLSQIYSQDKQGTFKGAWGAVKDILNEEINNSQTNFTQSVKNAEDNSVWQIRQWNYISKIYAAINNREKYPDYQSLVSEPFFKQFDIESNPYVNGVFLNTIFNLTTGARRVDRNGNYPTLELQDYNGLKLTSSKGNKSEGKVTTNLTDFEKLVQNFNTLLINGVQEHLRYGDKSSSFSTKITHILDPITGEITQRDLIIPITSFINDEGNTELLPQSLKSILIAYLRDEMIPMRRNLVGNVGKNWKYYSKNIKSLGIFDSVLSEETKEKVQNIVKNNSEEEIPSELKKLDKELTKDFTNYLRGQTKILTQEFSNDLLSPKDYISNSLLKYPIETLKAAYVANSFLYNVEHTKLVSFDPRFYKNAKDVIKRLSAFSATGNLFITDDQTNRYLATKPRALRDALISRGTEINPFTPNGQIRSVVFNDAKYSSKYFEIYKEHFINKGYSPEEAAKILNAYSEITEADGQGFITLDELRESKLRAGSSHWTKAHEAAYQKEAKFLKGESKTGASQEELALFVPQKWQYAGITLDELNNSLPVFYKFSVVPLIPSAIKDTPFEKIHENLIRQNVGLALFESGSKASAILNPDGKFNPFYSDNATRTPFTGDYTINTVFYNYLKEQVNVEPELKDKVTFSTQMRKLIALNLFSNGVPTDFKGTHEEWNKLSNQEKLSQSKYYQLEQKFSDIVENLVSIEKQNVLNEMGASFDESTQSYKIDATKLAQFLKNEFIRRELPDEAINYLQTDADNKFTFPLDAATQRDKIEKTAFSIANKRLVQQKISGESLIQVASTGFEKFTKPSESDIQKYGDSDLAPYIESPEGTKAAKVKIALTPKFEPLLNLSYKGAKIETLTRLNQALKDEEFVNTHRQMITLTAVRIPVQGLNSHEFMEVQEFLPAEAGNIIIVYPELVAKSGGDFDIDKLTTFTPNLTIENGETKLYSPKSQEELQKKYNSLIKEYKSKTKKDEAVDNLINAIFGISADKLDELQKQDAIDELFGTDTIPSFERFANLYNKKAQENELNNTITEILKLPENFEQLVRPNDTDLLKPYADELKPKTKSSWTNIVQFRNIADEFKSNLVGKANLGIAAINNTLFALSQRAGLYLNESYTPTGKKKSKQTLFHLPHNTITIGDKTYISLSGKYDVDNQHLISDVISQSINGFVDVAKDDWIFYINGVKEFVPTMLYATMAGVNNKTMISFFNQPVMKDYIKAIEKYKSLFVKSKNEKNYDFATRRALADIILNYSTKITDSELSKLIDTYRATKSKFEEPETQTTDFDVNVSLMNIEAYLSKLASQDKSLFTQETLYNSAFGDKPISPEQSLALLIHFNELKQQSQMVSNLQRSLNADTKKASNSFVVYDRRQRLKEVYDTGLFPKEPLERMFNESTIKAFTNTKTGFDAFVGDVFKELFEITNHPEFNRITRNLIANDKNLTFKSKTTNLEEVQNTLKNDFISYLYQNQVFWQDSVNLVSEVVKPLLRSKTSLANELQDIKTKYPNLEDIYPLLGQLTIDRSKKISSLKNIRLKTRISDRDELNSAVTQMRQLMSFDNADYTLEQQLEIQNFAKKLAKVGIIQSGLNKSIFNLMDIIPNETYSPDVKPAILGFKKLLDTKSPNVESELKKFYTLFTKNNEKYFNKGTEIAFNKETIRGKDYLTASAIDLTGEKSRIADLKNQEYIQSLPSKISFVPSTNNSKLIAQNPNRLYILESNVTNKLQSDLSDKGISNYSAIFTGESIGKPFTDDNIQKNKEIIDKALKDLIDKSIKYESIILTQDGYGAKLKEKAPKTLEYLSKQLYTFFNYVNQGYTPINIIENPIIPVSLEDKSEELRKINIQMQPDNIEKILNGSKTTTTRSESQAKQIGLNIGESGVVNFRGINFKITNRGLLTISEAGGKESIEKSENFENNIPKYQQTKDWLSGKGKLYVYDISKLEQNAEEDTKGCNFSI